MSTGISKRWNELTSLQMTEEERNTIYNELSATYEQETEKLSMSIIHNSFAKRIADLFPEKTEFVEILDVGAGTGLLGKELRKYGFKNIDALDPAEKMISIARDNNIYRKVFVGDLEEYLTTGNTEKYDAVISTGVLLPNHLPPNNLQKACNFLKHGGYLSFLTRKSVIENKDDYSKDVIKNLQQLEDTGTIHNLAFEQFENYHGNLGGIGINVLYQRC